MISASAPNYAMGVLIVTIVAREALIKWRNRHGVQKARQRCCVAK